MQKTLMERNIPVLYVCRKACELLQSLTLRDITEFSQNPGFNVQGPADISRSWILQGFLSREDRLS